ncbi:hypothetical protein [Methylobacillus flagellatus]|uniref:hypothetical protein n=1 Tax=Methylobacillus flagellatus TaxID=405 RepID=UPI0010F5B20A|nr:hypothetical protein [Methylobacillus flagellatus]
MNASNKTLAALLGTAFVASLAATSASAAENPFALKTLSSGYMVVADKGADGKCGTGKCAAEKGKEGSCGGDKAMEGKCSADKAKEGSCSGDKAKEGKCGTGKCGAEKK